MFIFITYVTLFTINILLVYTWLTHGIIDIGQLHAFVTQYMMDVQGVPQDVGIYFDLIFA
jgi:hypothetical protein